MPIYRTDFEGWLTEYAAKKISKNAKYLFDFIFIKTLSKRYIFINK